MPKIGPDIKATHGEMLYYVIVGFVAR